MGTTCSCRTKSIRIQALTDRNPSNRRLLPMQIGKLMKSGQAEEAEAIKQEVEKANDVAGSAEEAFEKVRLDSGATRPVYTYPNIHV